VRQRSPSRSKPATAIAGSFCRSRRAGAHHDPVASTRDAHARRRIRCAADITTWRAGIARGRPTAADKLSRTRARRWRASYARPHVSHGAVARVLGTNALQFRYVGHRFPHVYRGQAVDLTPLIGAPISPPNTTTSSEGAFKANSRPSRSAALAAQPAVPAPSAVQPPTTVQRMHGPAGAAVPG
jgi:hypothetical protein